MGLCAFSWSIYMYPSNPPTRNNNTRTHRRIRKYSCMILSENKKLLFILFPIYAGVTAVTAEKGAP